jgi:hypothetical protein
MEHAGQLTNIKLTSIVKLYEADQTAVLTLDMKVKLWLGRTKNFCRTLAAEINVLTIMPKDVSDDTINFGKFRHGVTILVRSLCHRS